MIPTLFPDQQRALQQARLAFTQHRRVLGVAPTAFGKTILCSAMAAGAVAKNTPVLWWAHREDLCNQGFDTLQRFGLHVGMISASSDRPADPTAPIQVCSTPTLLARGLRPRGSLIIFDEAHHAVAEETSTLLDDYPDAYVFGVTATPARNDGLPLSPPFQSLFVAAQVRELVAAGRLTRCRIRRPGKRLNSGEIAQRPVDAYLEFTPGRSAITFANTIESAEAFTKDFLARDIPARVVHGKIDPPLRRLYLEAYNRGDIRVLVNVNVLTEGTDLPRTGCVILARGMSPSALIQAAGRGARIFPGKEDYFLLDLHGSTHDHGSPEEDRSFSLTGRPIRRSGDEEDINAGPMCRTCGCPTIPGEPCDDCGEFPPKPKPVKVTHDPLIKYAQKRKETEEEKAVTLSRWIATGRLRGYKAGWAWGRFRAVYGSPPTKQLFQHASTLAGAMRHETA